jgi:hypothetical protein
MNTFDLCQVYVSHILNVTENSSFCIIHIEVFFKINVFFFSIPCTCPWQSFVKHRTQKMHILTDLGSNPSRRDGKPTTNRLSYGTAYIFLIGIVGGWSGWQGKPKYSEKTCPSAALFTTNRHAARTRTRAAAVGSQRLTAWATARPWHGL